MKRRIILLLVFSLLVCNSCSRQEKMSAGIFMERFAELTGDCSAIEENFEYNGKRIVFIRDNSGSEFVLELSADDRGNIRKICLAGNKPDKTDLMKHYSELIINTYAPQEDAKAVLSELFKNIFDFTDTQWYRYSSAVSDEGLFFSVENIKFLTESDAGLTLKQNDITYP